MPFTITNTEPLDSEEGYELPGGPFGTREEAEAAFNKFYEDQEYAGFSAGWYPTGGALDGVALAIGADGRPHVLHETDG